MNENIELYFEEQRQQFIEMHETLLAIGEYLKQHKEHVDVSGEVTVNTEKAVEITNISQLIERVDALGDYIAQAIAENKPELKSVVVENIAEALAKDVSITNLKDVEKYFTSLEKTIKANKSVINVQKQEIQWPTDPKNPISVRLSDGKAFYNAIVQAISGGVGVQTALTRNNGTTIAVTNPDGSNIAGGSGSAGDILTLNTTPTGTNNAQVTQSIIHGKTTAGGGSYVDVKVTPSGALSTNGEAGVLNTSDTRINPATQETLASLLIEMQINNGAYAQRTDDTGTGTIYRGWAVPGTATSAASWRITRIVETSGDFVMTFADGNNNFDNIWDNRVSLSYA